MLNDGVLANIFSWCLVLDSPLVFAKLCLVNKSWNAAIKKHMDFIWSRIQKRILQENSVDARIIDHFMDFTADGLNNGDKFGWVVSKCNIFERCRVICVSNTLSAKKCFISKCGAHSRDTVTIEWGSTQGRVQWRIFGPCVSYCCDCHITTHVYRVYDIARDIDLEIPTFASGMRIGNEDEFWKGCLAVQMDLKGHMETIAIGEGEITSQTRPSKKVKFEMNEESI